MYHSVTPEKVTPGPWAVENQGNWWAVKAGDRFVAWCYTQDDARFIAAAHDTLDELLELAGEVWLQWGLVLSDGRRDAGCLSTLEHAEEILRRYGRIDERGRFTWERIKNGDRVTGNRAADSSGAKGNA